MSQRYAPDEVRPLLASLQSPTRPLGATLPVVPSPPAVSPWSPRPEASGASSAAPTVDTRAIEEEARARGLAQGLAETAALRARLSQAVVGLELACERGLELASAQIADATVATISAWLQADDRAKLFAPLIERWLAKGAAQTGAVVRVHPADVDAMRAAIGDAPLEVSADRSITPGDVAIRGGAFELVHQWEARLAELRATVIAALDEEDAP